MISSDLIRGYNDLFILQILSWGDSYGYEIGKQITQLSRGAYIIKETTLYTAFNRLAKAQWIESYPGQESNGRARTYYRLTAKGQDALQMKTQEWQVVQEVVKNILKGEL